MPGLIPGASEGKGLGLEFLRHVERCSVLVHVLDCATLEPGRDPLSDLDVIEAELAAVRRRPGGDRCRAAALVVLNKVDVPEARELAEMVRPDLEARGLAVFEVSAVDPRGPAGADVRHGRRSSARPARPRPARRAAARSCCGPGPSTTPASPSRRATTTDGVRYRVRGEKPERWVRQTDFSNDEAVGYLADRLARLGVEEALVEAGRGRRAPRSSSAPTTNAVVFDWEPTIAAARGARRPRGSDLRLEDGGRATREERRERYEARRVARRTPATSSPGSARPGSGPSPSAEDAGDDEDAADRDDPRAAARRRAARSSSRSARRR